MSSISFLIVIYICFIMYGWTASLIGGVWPQIAEDINVKVSLLGILVMINYLASGVASMVTYKIRQKLGTSRSNILGLFCTTIGMITFALSKNIVMVAIAIFVLGFGSGIVDINSNCYVVKAHDAKDVSYMHACWGLGATIGPMVMSFAMTNTNTYRNGFYITAIILVVVMIVLFFMKRYWDEKKKTLDKTFVDLHSVTEAEKSDNTSFIELFKMKNVALVLMCFPLANGTGCALSAWIATIAVEQRGLTIAAGALAASIYFFALMGGRTIMGSLANKFGIANILRFCIASCLVANALYYIPFKDVRLVYIHAALLGFMSGPLIPLLNSILKEIFDGKILGALISYGGALGLLGVAIISAIMTMTVNTLSIHNIQIVPVVCFGILLIVYSKMIANTK